MRHIRLSMLVIVFIAILILAPSLTQSETNWNKQLDNLIDNYEQILETNHVPFILINEILSHFMKENKIFEAIAFLGRHIRNLEDDPNNAYYLFLIGTQYKERGELPMAQLYYLRAISTPDVYIDNRSVHHQSLLQLLEVEEEPHYKIYYLNQLINSLSHKNEIEDPGLLYYMLGENYSALGKWKDAYDAYTTFLRLAYNERSSLPFYATIERWIALYDSRRDWTVKNLDALVTVIKNALYTKNTRQLTNYKAKQKFFTMSWNQEVFDQNSHIKSFNVNAFLARSQVRFANKLELSSNNKEAYLRTWGWSHRIPVWYLYFRKIDFPVDPLTHGNWEWAGIYFGDSL